MKSSISLRITRQEQRSLRLIVKRHKSEYRHVVRAKIILQLAKGKSFSETARIVGVARRIVYKWLKRFNEQGLEGLKDRPRSGRPARFSPDRYSIFDQISL
jgi:transposase